MELLQSQYISGLVLGPVRKSVVIQDSSVILEIREVDPTVDNHYCYCNFILIFILGSSRRDCIAQHSFVVAEGNEIHAFTRPGEVLRPLWP